jgi:hypothetical protein
LCVILKRALPADNCFVADTARRWLRIASGLRLVLELVLGLGSCSWFLGLALGTWNESWGLE